MLTLSFIHNFAPQKIKPKTMDRKTKAFPGIFPCSSPSRNQYFQAKKHPPQKAFLTNLVLKKLYSGEIMSVTAVPNEVTHCVDNPKPNL